MNALLRNLVSPRIRGGQLALAALTYFVVAVSFLRHGKANLFDDEFWFDESGQYWMSLGQNHISEFNTPAQPFSLKEIADWNLDPPGFSLLLRAWMEVFGQSTPSLRLLPFLFALGFVFVIAALGKRFFGVPGYIGASVGLIALSGSIADQYTTELRAYSAELLAVSVLAFALLEWRVRHSFRSSVFLLTSMVFSLLFTRYSAIFAVASAAIIVLIGLIPPKDKKSWAELGAFMLVGTLSSAFLIWYVLSPGYGTHQTPNYVFQHTLGYASSLRDAWGFFVRNLLLPPGIPILIITILGLVLVLGKKLSPRLVSAITDRGEDKPFFALIKFVVAYQSLVIVTSSLGIHPWDMGARWSIGLVAVSAVATIGLLAVLDIELPFSKAVRIDTEGLQPTLTRTLKAITHAGILAMALYFSAAFSTYRHVTYERISSGEEGFGIIERTIDREAELPQTWHVQSHLWPTFRMVVERNEDLNLGEVEAFQVPDSLADDETIAAYLMNSVRCADRGSTHYLFRPQAESLRTTRKVLDEFAKKSECQVKIISEIDLAFSFSITRS